VDFHLKFDESGDHRPVSLLHDVGVDVFFLGGCPDMFDDLLYPAGRTDLRVITLQRPGNPDQTFAAGNQGDNLLVNFIDGHADSRELFPVGLGVFVVSVICGHVHDSI
jgi:hypothetical protein